tara:strand:- start:3497 stop:4906 length:1410 start_codon:yes stop_codon:yes gene_type:complete
LKNFDVPEFAKTDFAVGLESNETDEDITIPHGFFPREYQDPMWSALVTGERKRGVIVWHRRAGKDVTCWNLIVYKAMERIGLYFYCFPTFTQGRRIIWDGMGGDGRRYLDFIPESLIANINHTEMKIELVNGSIIQLIGVEQIDRLVGTNPIGLVFSEYSLQNPMAWELFRPILAENGGWALFEYTPRGHNHGWMLFDMARKNPHRWFCQLLTVDMTKRADGTPVITPEIIQEERESGMSEELIQQEFYCSFDAAIQGAYYSEQLRTAWKDGRVHSIPFDASLPTFSAWDLGMDDSTSIWVFQAVGSEIRMLRFFEGSGKGLGYYINALQELRNAQGFQWAGHFGPHDLKVRELGTGVSRLEAARSLGFRFKVVKKLGIKEGIEAVRRLFPQIYFDDQGCSGGLASLAEYTKEWDEMTKTFSDHPKHDWTSHAADSFRTFAVGWRERYAIPEHRRTTGKSIIAKTCIDD